MHVIELATYFVCLSMNEIKSIACLKLDTKTPNKIEGTATLLVLLGWKEKKKDTHMHARRWKRWVTDLGARFVDRDLIVIACSFMYCFVLAVCFRK